jgi:hypothetical protein
MPASWLQHQTHTISGHQQHPFPLQPQPYALQQQPPHSQQPQSLKDILSSAAHTVSDVVKENVKHAGAVDLS